MTNSENWLDPKNFGNVKVYYWNARLNHKTALLSGPFLTAKEAEDTADVVSPIFLQECAEARQATFGVMECKAPGAGEGRYNNHLPAHLIRNLAIAVRYN